MSLMRPGFERNDSSFRNDSSIVAGAAAMVVISILLFFLPAINGLIAGAVGGYMVGSVGRALVAAIIPAMLVALGLWILFMVFNLPVLGFVAGSAIGVIILLADLTLFLGAALGGFLARYKS